jgi:hypothetical protein
MMNLKRTAIPVTLAKLRVIRKKVFYGKTQSEFINVIMNGVKLTSFQWTYLLLPPAVGEVQRC